MFTPDFSFSMPDERDLRVLLLTDMQIIDASKSRTEDRLSPTEKAQWARDTIDKNCFDIVRQLVGRTKPDLILHSGDLVYGEFDDDGEILRKTIAFMDTLGVKYATCLGNHERDSHLSVKELSDIISHGKNSLFKMGELSGAGNFSVGIYRGEKLARVLCFLDSLPEIIGFKQDQTDWLFSILNCDEVKNRVPVSLVYHIQMNIVGKTLEKYGYPQIKFDIKNSETDFGYVGTVMKSPWDSDGALWNRLLGTSVDSHFFGHEHCNNASLVASGVRLHYVLKSSTYDRCNYLLDDRSIHGSFTVQDNPIVGGSFFEMNDDGEIKGLRHIYYNKE